tara:strand:- start:731 stop:1366 length:636 start_codon:yes stop_codon:yes gene_type:complete
METKRSRPKLKGYPKRPDGKTTRRPRPKREPDRRDLQKPRPKKPRDLLMPRPKLKPRPKRDPRPKRNSKFPPKGMPRVPKSMPKDLPGRKPRITRDELRRIMEKNPPMNPLTATGKPRRKYKKGGSSFPDLTGDGKVTQADILKGRKVFRKGGGSDTHVTKDGRTVKKGLYYYMNRAKKRGTSRKGKGTVTDKALARSAKTAKKPAKKKKA